MRLPPLRRRSIFWHVVVVALALPTGFSAETLKATFDPVAREVIARAEGLAAGAYELRLDTPGLQEFERGGDVNEPGIIYLPPREGRVTLTEKPRGEARAEIVFFFNPLRQAEGWQLVLQFPAPARGRWKLNGRFSDQGGALASECSIPATALEPGENLLYIEGENLEPPTLFFRRSWRSGEAVATRFGVNSPEWSGRLSLRRSAPADAVAEIAAVTLTGRAATRRDVSIAERWWEKREMLVDAAMATGHNLLSAQIDDPHSFFQGGFHLVYDPKRHSHRISHWIWSWGPSIKLLLELAELPMARERGLDARLRAAASAAGRRSLAFEMTDLGHPAAGVSTVRWEPSRAVPGGWVEYLSTADSLFLAGWGWMSLHAATGETVYLERTRRLIAAAERLMGQYPVVPQDWVVERRRWTPHTLDESVFGMIGFRAAHAATNDAAIAAAGRRYLDSHLQHMGRESGLLERAWMREEDRAIWDPDIKGHAWVVEGYLDAHQLSGDTRYLGLARELAARVIACQDEEGAWTYLFKKPGPQDPRDDKGTAIWAYMLYTLHRTTGDAAHLAAARRALGWCLRHQYRGDDPNLEGGLLHENGMAYVRRRPMTILYSTTFFGLALLEELALADGKKR